MQLSVYGFPRIAFSLGTWMNSRCGVGSLAADREVTVDQDRPEDVAARQRDASIVEELRKAELVRDRLEGLQQLVGSYPEGHRTRVLLEELHLERALEALEEDIAA